MKQISTLMTKVLFFYYLSCIVCSFVFSLFYHFDLFDIVFFEYIAYAFGFLLLLLSCLYLVKKCEKKTLLYIAGLLLIVSIISVSTMSFTITSFVKLIVKITICFMLSLFVLIRK